MSLATRPIQDSIRILLLGEHAIVRAALRMLIESRPGLKVVAEAPKNLESLDTDLDLVDLIVLDVDLELESSLRFLADLMASAPLARVLLLTATTDPEAYSCAVRLGAMGVVQKERPAEVLLKAIEKIHAGEVWLERSTIAHLIGGISRASKIRHADPETAKIATLSVREREVIAVIGEGLKNKQIAGRLFISEATVRHHLSSIFSKLGVADRFELLIYAYRHSLAKPPF
jgi:DNA-binding NarL/FixJ family response regulator